MKFLIFFYVCRVCIYYRTCYPPTVWECMNEWLFVQNSVRWNNHLFHQFSISCHCENFKNNRFDRYQNMYRPTYVVSLSNISWHKRCVHWKSCIYLIQMCPFVTNLIFGNILLIFENIISNIPTVPFDQFVWECL